LDIKVQVSAKGYKQPIEDQSSNEVMVNTTPPAITWDSVTLDDIRSMPVKPTAPSHSVATAQLTWYCRKSM
jgi:hypothetical protein